ncbi:alpha/beta hydrolase [Arsenicicoccus dermatophilus]|uniref:alpha/beta hydrolase n=1 Tax=Arsenicicoccus dermatophilus TaxID=1076331 RepID=UPI003917014D
MSSHRPPLTLRATRMLVRGLVHLPDPLRRLMAGRPHRVDGRTLRPDVQLVLRLLAIAPGDDATELTPVQWRDEVETEAWMFGHRPYVAMVRDTTIPGPAGPLDARIYDPRPGEPKGAVVTMFHGGGFVAGSLESVDPVCRFVARYVGCPVVSVAYRLAPEDPYPCAVEDAIAAFRWVRDHREELAGPRARVAVMGDDAGATLAAVVSHRTVEDERGGPDLQVLISPVVDLSRKTRSYEQFSRGYLLTEATMDWYLRHYLREPERAVEPDASPLLARHFGGLPPAYVLVPGFSVLRDEGLAYAAALQDADVPVTVRLDEGGIHGDLSAMGISPASRDLLVELCETVRGQLGLPS